jgi:pyrroline-5-carboxylate reductase
MGTAILAGLIRHRIMSPGRIFVHDVVRDKARRTARKYGVRLAANPEEIARQSGIVILAFKPQDLKAAAPDLAAALTPRHLVITILAGVKISRVRKSLGGRPAVVRAMPNLGAVVGEAVTALTGPRGPHLAAAKAIFSGCGQVLVLPESKFDLVTALSGSGPAYFFYLMELLIREGMARKLSKDEAETLIRQTAKGAAVLANGAGEPPASLRARVTSKGGTTEAALKTLARGGFPRLFSRAIGAAVRRARELGGG